MLHRRGCDHHDVPSSWFSRPPRGNRTANRRTTGTTCITRTVIQGLTR
jgi:hypothetical protein